MAKAYILIETVVGRTREVANKLSQIPRVKAVDTVTGPYDIIAVIEGETLDEIGDTVTQNIGGVEGISRTVTCLRV